MTVSSSASRNQYTATAGQTVFAYTFEIVSDDDIVVLKNGVTLTKTADYTVSGVGVNSGGNVTLVVGATAGDILTLYRDMAYERLTDYTNAGDFLAADVNNDFDRLWIATQQVNEEVNRSLKAPVTDPLTIDMTLPAKADRLGKYLKFNDTTGDPESGDIAGAFTAAGMNVYNFTGDGSTVNFTLGMEPGGENNTQVYIDGVYQQKDTYNLSGAVIQFSAAPPNLSTIEVMVVQVLPVGATTASQVSFTQAGSTTARNVQLKLQESVSVKDFGAVGDGVTDDTAAIQAAIDSVNSAGGGVVSVPQGTYMINALSRINMKENINLFIARGAELKAITNNYQVYSVVRATNVNNWSITGSGKLTGERTTHTGTLGEGGECITVFGCENFIIDGLTIQDGWGDGIYIGGNVTVNQSRSFTIQNCYLNNNRRNNISVTAGRDFSIINNRITNANGTAPEAGIDLEPNPSDAWDVEDCTISNNVIWANLGSGITCSAIYHGNTIISNNVVHGNGINGIASFNSQAPVIITDNLCFENAGYGIRLSGASSFDQFNSSINGNTSHNNGEDGITIRSNIQACSVTGNIVYENDKNGISLDRDLGGTMFGIQVANNYVHSNSQDANDTYDNIRLVTGASTTILQNNRLWKGLKTNKPKYGINIADSNCDNTVLMQNIMSDSGNTGPYASLTTNVIVRNNIGYTTENAVLSPSFAIDAATNVTVTIPHGCSFTPTRDQIQLTVVEDTSTSWSPGSIRIQSVDATNITVIVTVDTAAAASSTAKLSALIMNL
jgi:polygalacturonase